MVDETVAAFGKIDILFLNAGIAFFSPHAEITEEFFDNHFNTNVKGPFFQIKEALPHLNDGAVALPPSHMTCIVQCCRCTSILVAINIVSYRKHNNYTITLFSV